MQDPELRWWHVRWGLAGRLVSRFAVVSGKIVGLLCLIAVVAAVILYLLEPWLTARHFAKTDPQLTTIPIRLLNRAEASLSGPRISRDGISFQLPDEAPHRTIALQRSTLVPLPGGNLEFLGPLHDEDSIAFASVHRNKDADALLSQDMFHSRFELLQTAMEMTPEEVKWWRLRSRRNRRAELLLAVKFAALIEYSPLHSLSLRPLYRISSGEFRGFQFGDPNKFPYDTHIDLFDSADRHLGLDISGLDGRGPAVTQEQVNAMVASIRASGP